MDGGTWVALVVGLGSLAVTLELDRRNRRERQRTASEERSERERRDVRERSERSRTRWTGERLGLYAEFLDRAEARLSAVGHRIFNLHHGVWSGYPNVRLEGTDFEETERPDRSTEASRQIALLAPAAVADRCDALEGILASLEWSAVVADAHLASSQIAPEAETLEALDKELEAASTAVGAVRWEMRLDLDVDS